MIKIAKKRKIDVRKSKPFEDKYGNIIVRKEHERTIEVPNISNKTKESIKTGKSKMLNEKKELQEEKDINIFQNDDETWWVIEGQEGDPNNNLLGVWDTKEEARIHLLEERIRKLDREISTLESEDSLNEDIRDLDITREELLEELEDLRERTGEYEEELRPQSRKICNSCGKKTETYADLSRKLCSNCLRDEDKAIMSLGSSKSEMVICKECGGEFPIEIMRSGYCYTCADNREIIRLWKKGDTIKEIDAELDYLPYDRIKSAIEDEIKSLEKQSPRE